MTASSRLILVLPLLVALSCASADPKPRVAMVGSNADLARSGYDAFARGDIPGVLALMDPAITWYEAESLPYGGVHRGAETVLEKVFMALGGDWQPFAAIPQEYIEAGNHVVVLGEYRATSRATGRSFVAPFAHIWRFENGRLIEFRQLTDTAKWLEAMRRE